MVVFVLSSFFALGLLARDEVMFGELWAIAIAELTVRHIRSKVCGASMVAILSGLLFGLD